MTQRGIYTNTTLLAFFQISLHTEIQCCFVDPIDFGLHRELNIVDGFSAVMWLVHAANENKFSFPFEVIVR